MMTQSSLTPRVARAARQSQSRSPCPDTDSTPVSANSTNYRTDHSHRTGTQNKPMSLQKETLVIKEEKGEQDTLQEEKSNQSIFQEEKSPQDILQEEKEQFLRHRSKLKSVLEQITKSQLKSRHNLKKLKDQQIDML